MGLPQHFLQDDVRAGFGSDGDEGSFDAGSTSRCTPT